MKTFKIEVPNGYEIDKEKSTFENIVFKEVKKELPKTWQELGEIIRYYTHNNSDIFYADCITTSRNRNLFATEEQAEASLALAQLSQLREVYRNGWKPDWTVDKVKFCIGIVEDKIIETTYYQSSTFLSFQDEETRDLFLENFRDLIEQAKPLMS
jgi:hypothetical protein